MQRPPLLFIVAGERGFKAAQQVGLATVPGICVEASTQPGRVGGGWKANYQGLTPFIYGSPVRRDPVVRRPQSCSPWSVVSFRAMRHAPRQRY